MKQLELFRNTIPLFRKHNYNDEFIKTINIDITGGINRDYDVWVTKTSDTYDGIAFSEGDVWEILFTFPWLERFLTDPTFINTKEPTLAMLAVGYMRKIRNGEIIPKRIK